MTEQEIKDLKRTIDVLQKRCVVLTNGLLCEFCTMKCSHRKELKNET